MDELEERNATAKAEAEVVSVLPALEEDSVVLIEESPAGDEALQTDGQTADAVSEGNKKLMDDLCRMKMELQAAQRTVEETKAANT